jgi:ketosteroid isomerase-like protein
MRTLPALFVLVCCAMYAGSASGQDRAADRAEIEANERAWSLAFVTGDASAPQRFIAEDYSGAGTDGSHYSKKDEIANMRGPAHTTRANVDSVQVTFLGDVAVSRTAEHDTGPAPELRPQRSLSTDVWVKRNGHWQAVEGMYADLGLPVQAASAPDVEAIRHLRDATNKALAAHDSATLLEMFEPDAWIAQADGLAVTGRDGLQHEMDKESRGADPAARIQAPGTISVSEDGRIAMEHGRWADVHRDRVAGGDYVAQWVRTAAGWKVSTEMYVQLYSAKPSGAR